MIDVLFVMVSSIVCHSYFSKRQIICEVAIFQGSRPFFLLLFVSLFVLFCFFLLLWIWVVLEHGQIFLQRFSTSWLDLFAQHVRCDSIRYTDAGKPNVFNTLSSKQSVAMCCVQIE